MTMDTEQAVLELEREFWKADPEFHDRHYASDIVTLIDGQVIGRDDGVAMIRGTPALTSLAFRDVHVRHLTERSVAVAYHATSWREGDSEPYIALVGSVYVHRDGRWQLAFHQHAPQPSAT